MSAPRLSLEAFAKVNRYLLVLGRRPDGLHELDTLFETIDLSDRLTFEEADELELVVDDPALPSGDDNLVLGAARSLKEAFPVKAGARIALEKRIPWGAGLGGGSSDAAAGLRALAALWKLPVTREELVPFAAALGSDVPFFLYGGRAHGSGRGERIEPLPDGERAALVLLSPPFTLSTPEVYRRLNAPALTVAAFATNLCGSDSGGYPDRNDLEPAAESLREEVRHMRAALLSAGAESARLSGSGSTVFGVFRDIRTAEEAALRLGGLPAGTRVRVVTTLSRAEFDMRATPRAEG